MTNVRRSQGRQSGRTTDMLLDALAARMEGASVCVIAHSTHYANDLQNQFDHLADELGCGIKFPPNTPIAFIGRDEVKHMLGRRFDRVFIDHAVFDKKMLNRDTTRDIYAMINRP